MEDYNMYPQYAYTATDEWSTYADRTAEATFLELKGAERLHFIQPSRPDGFWEDHAEVEGRVVVMGPDFWDTHEEIGNKIFRK